MSEKVDLLIVVPPFAAIEYPPLGPSLLSSKCQRMGINTYVFYPNLELAARVGPERYAKFYQSRNSYWLLGEALFAPYAFNKSRDKIMSWLFNGGRHMPAFGRDQNPVCREDYLVCDSLMDSFLDYCVRNIIEKNPKIVGFSSVFLQNLPSLAISRRLKTIQPDILTVIGGNNVKDHMGKALAKVAFMIDYIFSGEADTEFPKFCEAYLKGKSVSSGKVIDCDPIHDMDSLEIPKYENYFDQLSSYQFKGIFPKDWPLWLHFESSRGCWWGAKRRCAFCGGLKANELRYRRKSAHRIVSEMEELKNRYNVKHLHAADNIMPDDFRIDVLPKLAERDDKFVVFYEVKSNVGPSVLDAFISAGVVTIQAGIESLSSNILEKLRKGVSAVQNLRFLRDASSRQIHPYWNLLVGIPGETKKDYYDMLNILPLIEHLQPPVWSGPVRIDRFSPYFVNSSAFGINNIKPFPIYRVIYPDGACIEDIAYYFVGNCRSAFTIDNELREKFEKAIDRWILSWYGTRERPCLRMIPTSQNMVLIEDTRACAKEQFFMASSTTYEVLKELEMPVKSSKFCEDRKPVLFELLKRNFVVLYEDYYISLVTNPSIGINLRRQSVQKSEIE